MIYLSGWLTWLIASAALLIGEIFTATFFLLCFSFAALIASALSALGLSMTAQWAGFAISAATAIAISQRCAHRMTKETSRKANSERLIGKAGTVIEEINEERATGRIRVGHEEWRAVSAQSAPVPRDSRVIVTGLEGTHLMVELSEKDAEVTEAG
jgi:membrane protein implicated in regulation of membrane protease activity